MYKDVWKRVLAMMLTVCLIVALMPETVMAAETKNYHTYQHGAGSSLGWVESSTVAAMFTVGKNTSGGAEVLDSISFNAHIEDKSKDATATVSYYVNPTQGKPDSGTYVCAKPMNTLQEGLNAVEIGVDKQELKAGDTFSAVITLDGASIAYYGGASAGQTYVSENGSWQDMSEVGQCVAIRAYTYDVGDDGEDGQPWLEQFVSAFSLSRSSEDVGVATASTTPASLNKTNMVVPVGCYGDIILNDAEGTVSWSVGDSSIAEIGGNGNYAHIEGKATGETTITATYAGETYTCKLKVTSSVEDADVVLNPDSATYDGERHSPLVNVSIGETKLEANTDYQVNCSSIDEQGVETAVDMETAFVNAGVYRFTVVGTGAYGGTNTIDYVIAPKQITDTSIEVVTGTWDAANPKGYITSVTDKATGVALTLGDETSGDYYLVEATNDAGEAGINIVGRGNYAGTRFCVTPKSVAGAQITFDQNAYVYLGKEWQPAISVVIGGVVLSQSDYTVAYSNNTDAGTATVTVTGQNGYYDVATATFEILQKDVSNADQELIQSPVEAVVSNAVGSENPEVVVTYNGMTLTENTDYTLKFTSDLSAGTGECTITGIGKNFKGTRTENYTIASSNINDYANGIAFTASGTATLEVLYTGAAMKPAVVLTKDSQILDTLKEGRDYCVIYTNNVEVGLATVTVKGIGSYAGTLAGNYSFTIAQADLADMSYQFKDADGNAVSTSGYKVSYSLNVADLKPGVLVKNAQGETLTEGIDYKLTYSVDTTGAAADLSGGLTVTVDPINTNYKGSKTLNYSIQKCNLETAVKNGVIVVTLNKDSFNYTGSAQVPEATLTYAATGDVLVLGRDYKAAPSVTDPTDAGDYKLMITGMGNYAGYVEMPYKITSIDIQTIADITPVNGETGYKGSWFALKWFDGTDEENNKLKLAITDENGNTLAEGTASDPKDYTLSYENIDAVSTSEKYAKVKITGHGAYTGERTIYYLLAGKLEDYEVSVKGDEIVYTGEAIDLKNENVTVTVKKGILWWKSELEQDVDYKLVYSDNVNAGTAKFVVEPVADTMLPTANGCYRYAEGIADSGKLAGTFTIGQKDISDETEVTLINAVVKEYQGTDITLTAGDIPLTYNGMKLDDHDFAIVENSYVNNDAPSNDASVTITGQGNYKGTRKIAFAITGKSLADVIAEVEEVSYTGEALYPEIKSLKTADGTALVKDQDYTYEKADYTDNTNAGDGTITIHGLNEYLGSTVKIPFTIAPRNIGTAGGDCTVEGVEAAGYTYTSRAIEPTVAVKYQASGTSARKNLVEGVDYEVSYRDNLNCTASAAVIIAGKGNYTGTYEKTFEIKAKDIADTQTDIIVANIPSQEYNGGIAVTPVPNISYQYGSADTDVYQLSSEDYTLAYEGQNKVGTAKITITGQGNFTGERIVTYHIGNAITDVNKVSVTCPEVESGTAFVYKASPYEPTVVVKNLTTGGALEKDKDYTVTYENNTDTGTATVVVEGTGSYAGVKKFNFTVVPKNLADSDVSLAIEGKTDGGYQATYTGSPVEPEVTLDYNGKEVDGGYSVTYSGTHTDIGFVNVTVTALANGNFTGAKTVQNTTAAKFEIVAVSIGNGGSTPASGFKMDAVEPQPLGATGAATPTPKLYFNGTALRAGVDYTYSYEKNTAIGKDATVILTGRGNYTGSVRQKFEIRGSIEGASVEVSKEIWYKDYVTTNPNNGAVTLPTMVTFDDKIKVTANGVELVQGTDYELSYANNTWVGMATVTVKGIGSYAGVVTKEVPIQADLAETDVTVPDQKYTGNPVKAVPIVEYYGTALTEGEHFIIHTYENNTSLSNKGASVTIIGNEENGFTGTRTENFSIKADAEALTVSGVETSYMYRGAAIEPTVAVKLGNTTLTPNDYEVTYGTNTNVGKGTIVVKGKGAYEGLNAKSILFDIVAQDINSLTVLDGTSSAIADREYTGLPILPELILAAKIGSATYEMQSGDYTVTAKTDNVSVGTVTLLIEGTGNVTGSREVTFDITPKSLSKPVSGTDTISMQVTQDTYAYDGTAKEPEVIVTYQYGAGESEVRTLQKDTDYTITYSNNIAAGTAKVIVNGIGNYSGSRTAEFTITAQDISIVTVILPNGTSYPYMGSTVAVEPEVVVTAKGVTLTKDKDYTVSYQNNNACGTAIVTITGKGDFNGTTATTFTIEEHSINAADVVVEPIPNQAYTGLPIVPELTITCGDYELKKGVDYELTCTGNTEIGQAAVTIKGVNGFKDSRMEIFKIASSIASAEVIGLKDSYMYTGQVLTAAQLGITEVRIGNTVLSTSDYTVGFAKGSDGISAGKQTVVLTGTGSYGGSKEFEITIAAKNIADSDIVMTGFADSLPYTEALTQNITLTWGAITLQKGTDYEVTCSPSQDADTYVMTVTGMGNYTGTITKNFLVEQAAVDSLEIKDMSSNYTYTGTAIEPKPTILLGDVELKEGIDYTLTYSENENVGVATMRITGTGTCFTDEKEVTFTILRRSINHGTFSQIATQIYTGKDLKPAVIVTDNGKTLTEGTDYTLMYKNNRRTGTASVVVAGKGNYTSTKTIPFAIRPCNVASVAVTGTSSTTVSLSWMGEGVVTGYEIYCMDASGKWQLVGGTKGTTYTDAKLSAGTAYSYKVRSYVVEDGETYYGEFSTTTAVTTSK